MGKKKAFKTITEEVLANGIGWVAGIFAVQLLDEFFIEKRWWNLWGIFSKKTAVTGVTFGILEWTLTAVIGFTVMMFVNKFVRNKFLKKKAVAAVTGIANKITKSKEEQEATEQEPVNPAFERVDDEKIITKSYDETDLQNDEDDYNNLNPKE